MKATVIDVGNTSTAISLYNNGKLGKTVHIDGGILKYPKDCATALCDTAYGTQSLDCVVLGSVVPKAIVAWQRLVKRELRVPVLNVDATIPLPIRVDYPEPESIGADRLADAAGAVARYGAPAIVCDFGTALTFDVVTPESCYIGGAICPGIPLMGEYLNERTAKLPKIEFKGSAPKIGRSTEGAMLLGAQIGYRGMVRELIAHFRATLGWDFKVIATGGYAAWALKDSGIDFVLDQTLTLFGLGVIGDHALALSQKETE